LGALTLASEGRVEFSEKRAMWAPGRRLLEIVLVACCAACGGSSDGGVPSTSPPSSAQTRIVLSRDTLTLFVDQSTQLTATVTNAQGNILTGQLITWRSSDASVATVSASGLVVATGLGAANIEAAVGAVSSRAMLAVQLPTP